MSEIDVREAFRLQSVVSNSMDAPFTGRLCRLLGERLDRSGAIGRRVLDWSGAPAHDRDALPLRLAGGLNALARSGQAPGLTAAYPPNEADDQTLWSAVQEALTDHADFLSPWLDGPPQTNEVGRSAALMAGLLVLADRFGLPFSLYELGASAGLNTVLDRFGYRLGETLAGDAGSPLQLTPEWRGASPPAANVRIAARRGVDQAPLDVSRPETRERLLSYVWAEQFDRRARLEIALDIAAMDPAPIDAADAADWLEAVLRPQAEPGVCRVVMHTIAFQYFPPEVQACIEAHMIRVGASASEQAPVAWLGYEAGPDGGDSRLPELRLTTWPGEEMRRLARGQAHGRWLEWLDQPA